MKHLVVTPYQNEEDYIGELLGSMQAQIKKPDQWILINDNSIDKSFEIVQNYANKCDWIVNLESSNNSDQRQEGSKIIKLVYEALDYTDLTKFDIFTKLDADIRFKEDYFQLIFDQFSNNPNAGLCGGKIISLVNGCYIDEGSAKYHIRGANKSYRVSALVETNCFRPVMGWDGLDEMILMYHGYDVNLIETTLYQERSTRERFNEISFNFNSAYGKYKLGHSIVLVLLRSIKRLFNRPYIFGGLAYFFGHLAAMLKNEEIIIEKNVAKFINNFHYKRIFKKK